MTQLAEDLSCLSLDSTLSASLTAEACCKLAQLVKTRNIMEFISHTSGSGQSPSPFSPEEISLLQNIPEGTWNKFLKDKDIVKPHSNDSMLGDPFMSCYSVQLACMFFRLTVFFRLTSMLLIRYQIHSAKSTLMMLLMYFLEWTVCILETFTPPGSQVGELIICRVRAGFDPVLVKINTTSGEEQNNEKAVCHFIKWLGLQVNEVN